MAAGLKSVCKTLLTGQAFAHFFKRNGVDAGLLRLEPRIIGTVVRRFAYGGFDIVVKRGLRFVGGQDIQAEQAGDRLVIRWQQAYSR